MNKPNPLAIVYPRYTCVYKANEHCHTHPSADVFRRMGFTTKIITQLLSAGFTISFSGFFCSLDVFSLSFTWFFFNNTEF